MSAVSTIYEPSGKAREYSPLALNVYSACDHGCTYCYARRMWRPMVIPRKNIIEALKEKLETEAVFCRQVLLSFLSDPYCNAESELIIMREILPILARHDVPVAILTKGGERACRDIDLFRQFKRFQIGATLTFDNDIDFMKWEPRASRPSERIEMLRKCHEVGLRTFVSFEPVLAPEQSLRLMKFAAPYTQHYKIGRWNHDQRAKAIDWLDFGIKAVNFCRENKKIFYIKDDLAKVFPDGFLRPEERNPDLLEI